MIARTKYLTQEAFRSLGVEVRGLQNAAYVLALFALFSSLLGLLRERLFAHFFGAGTTLDLYNTAFNIPDFLLVVMGALVSVYTLIPELSRRSAGEQRNYIDTIVVGFSVLSIVVCAVAVFITPAIFVTLFPKLVAAGHLEELTALTRIMLLQPILLGFSNIFAAINQVRHRYFLYAVSPLLYNFGIISGILVLYPLFNITGLALGVVGGAFLHLLVQVPSVVSDGFFKKVPRHIEYDSLISTIATSLPRALALSMSQVTFVGLKVLAGMLSAGSISVFMYAYNLQAVPLAIIGASYSVAAFPGLAAALARGERALFIDHVATVARYVAFWSLPATALIIVLRAHIVRVILGTGAFDWTDTRLTAAAFAIFSLGLVAQGLSLLIIRAYYASGRSFTPFIVSLFVAVATIGLGAASVGALNIPFVREFSENFLRVADVPGSEVLALAFAFAIASILGALFLVLHFEYRFRGFVRKVALSWLQALAAALGAGIAAYMTLHVIGPITLSSTLLTVFTRGFTAGVIGLCTATLLYAMLGTREYYETVAAIKARVYGRRAAPLAPDVVTATEEQITP